MSLRQALAYFCREACVSLIRSWKVSLLAVLTIGASLFVGGVFLAVGGNLARAVESWRAESRVIAYLAPEAAGETLQALAREVAEEPWVTAVETVSREEASRRFATYFPTLADLAEGWGEEDALPASIEISFDPAQAGSAEFGAWLEELRGRPQVEMVDDDRDWLAQLQAVVAVVRGVGLGLGLVLLGAAVFIIASIVRLTAYLYQDEIDVMRLAGATEFFIRGPFYAEGLIQGLAGGLLASGALYGAYRVAAARAAASAWGEVLTHSFLSWGEVLALVLLGAVSGLVGAVVSLRREQLGTVEP